MRGSKAKAIRRSVREMVGENTGTEYDVITHPAKQRPNALTGEPELYNPRQIVVKSPFRQMVQAAKREYNTLMRGDLQQAALQLHG